MTVMVTGGAGFIGSHIVDAIIGRGLEVVVVDNLSTGKREYVNDKARLYHADLTERNQIHEIFKREDVDVIFHEAAQVQVRKSMEDPISDARCNILGSINLLEAAVNSGVKKFIYASSGGAIYGEPRYLPVDENHPVHPLSPYGASKYTVEKYLDVYKALYGLKSVSLRYGNVYGPRQDPLGEAGVIAIFANRILRGRSPVIFGDGEQTRDFVYVEDVAEANMVAMERSAEGAFNIGTGKASSVNDVSTILREEFQSSINPVYGEPVEGEVRHIHLDISKAKKELGWKPKVDLGEGIRRFLNGLAKT